MKLSFVALSALAFVVAASPANVRGQDTTSVDLIEESVPAIKLDQDVNVAVQHDERSAAQLDPRDPENDAEQASEKLVTVIIGNLRQNVGNLVGPSLYHEVYWAIKALCGWDPIFPGRCNGAGSRRVRIQFWRRPAIVKEEDLLISVKSSYFNSNMDLKDLMIGTVAAAVQRSSEDPKNCATVAKNALLDPVTHCNIGDRVRVEAPNRNHLEVMFKSSQRVGRFDCVAIVQATDRDVQTLLPLYAKALGGGTAVRNVYCPSKKIT